MIKNSHKNNQFFLITSDLFIIIFPIFFQEYFIFYEAAFIIKKNISTTMFANLVK